jgi:molybdopterin synthase sulfur carrier subunit
MLRNLTGDEETVTVDAGTVGEMIDALATTYPGIGPRLRNAEGALNKFINYYVNGEDIRFMENAQTALKEGDEVSVVPSVAGGKE